MPFTLQVLAPSFPNGLVMKWPEALAPHGLNVELWPGFAADSWPGGELRCRLQVVPQSFPTAERYGRYPVPAAFEIAFDDIDPAFRDAFLAAHGARLPVLAQCRRVAQLDTATGCSVADMRLQCFAAATLAELAGGVMVDPQHGAYLAGADAVARAAREADAYEADVLRPEWQLPPFAGWRQSPWDGCT